MSLPNIFSLTFQIILIGVDKMFVRCWRLKAVLIKCRVELIADDAFQTRITDQT